MSSTHARNVSAVRIYTGGSHYAALCRVVKKNSVYDKESGLWVKKSSLEPFAAYRAAQKKMLDDLVARNRKYAIEVLGGRPAAGEG